jgi:hypothetical protein
MFEFCCTRALGVMPPDTAMLVLSAEAAKHLWEKVCDVSEECLPGLCRVFGFDQFLWAYGAVQVRASLHCTSF